MNDFFPRDGALIDLPGLEAIAEFSERLITPLLKRLNPGSNSLVVWGLEPNGKRPKKNGPPGVMQFKPNDFTLSEGLAIVPRPNGQKVVFRFDEPQLIMLEEPIHADQNRTLVLTVVEKEKHDPAQLGSRLAVNELSPVFKFVDSTAVDLSTMLPLAEEMASKIWSTDLSRLWTPDHPALQLLFQHLDELEDVIWESDRHGTPWNNSSLGRDWKTYQTKASVAVTSARFTLSMRPSTSADRARVIKNLNWQLQRSVEQASELLKKWMGAVEATDSLYAAALSDYPEEWDEIF